ncbi:MULTISPECIES: hypothetical protein [Listeria]|uniref:hypothetical protein n=1 Tax=Listeria TaxID=1637 RepID=UPI0010EA64F5|nr:MULTISPECIES: hypothetical protein [Listeria]MBC1623812.1 hypothetical protein [Listeria welshimeri]EAD7779988.1 hypothetical protein [Listeria monocytogenes]EAF1401242.1 hypothetical protein [Listeria monocytogenes]EBF5842114.1 hypothetical protein [Listeria monocytogenes]EFS6816343.1 hypothetical protein [Listeria monocytogenes]
MSEVKVDYKTFASESAKLEQAITQFEPFTARFTAETVPRLDGFNSDFIESLRGTLTNMADDTGPELLATIKTFSQKVQVLTNEFETLDEELANQGE